MGPIGGTRVFQKGEGRGMGREEIIERQTACHLHTLAFHLGKVGGNELYWEKHSPPNPTLTLILEPLWWTHASPQLCLFPLSSWLTVLIESNFFNKELTLCAFLCLLPGHKQSPPPPQLVTLFYIYSLNL